jgi:hypothetical protein
MSATEVGLREDLLLDAHRCVPALAFAEATLTAQTRAVVYTEH